MKYQILIWVTQYSPHWYTFFRATSMGSKMSCFSYSDLLLIIKLNFLTDINSCNSSSTYGCFDCCYTKYDLIKHLKLQYYYENCFCLGNAYGMCLKDAFSISSPGAMSSPVICGTNTGYHMILDSDGTNCQTANFNIGTSTTTTRQWNIRVTQYTCAQQDESGPPGCLQYYTQTSNHIMK